MAFKGEGGDEAIGEINITPLVDVMLVLLVVFMVTTPIITEEVTQRKVEIDLPSTDAKPVQRGDLKAVVYLSPDFSVMLDLGEGPSTLAQCPPVAPEQQQACLEPLAVKLEKNPRLAPDQPLYFISDRSLPYGFVIDVMARVKKAGFTKVGMVTDPPAGEGQ
jgi:biopolymer transport protein TolR